MALLRMFTPEQPAAPYKNGEKTTPERKEISGSDADHLDLIKEHLPQETANLIDTLEILPTTNKNQDSFTFVLNQEVNDEKHGQIVEDIRKVVEEKLIKYYPIDQIAIRVELPTATTEKNLQIQEQEPGSKTTSEPLTPAAEDIADQNFKVTELLDKTTKEKERLAAEVEDLFAEILRLKEKLKLFEEKNAEESDAHLATSMKLSQLEEANKAEIGKLQKELLAAQTERDLFKIDLQKAEEHLNELRDELKEAEARASQEIGHADRFASEYDELKAEKDKLETEVAKLRDELFTTAAGSRDRLEAINSRDKEIATLNEKVAELEKTLAAERHKSHEDSNSISEAEAANTTALERQSATITKLQGQVERLRSQLKEKTDEIEAQSTIALRPALAGERTVAENASIATREHRDRIQANLDALTAEIADYVQANDSLADTFSLLLEKLKEGADPKQLITLLEGILADNEQSK